MSHFLLALVVVGLAVVLVLEAWSHHAGRAPSGAPAWLTVVAGVGIVACAVMVVTGAIVTASGPHPGADSEVERLGLGITDTVYVHVRAAAVFGVGLLVVGWFVVRLRHELPGVIRLGVALVTVVCAQMILGEVQYRNALPWGLVLAHVALAAVIWALTIAVAYALWRPPLPLAAALTHGPPSGNQPSRL
jgi:cytochrome c oxidase assembly protein subunit 15